MTLVILENCGYLAGVAGWTCKLHGCGTTVVSERLAFASSVGTGSCHLKQTKIPLIPELLACTETLAIGRRSTARRRGSRGMFQLAFASKRVSRRRRRCRRRTSLGEKYRVVKAVNARTGDRAHVRHFRRAEPALQS